MDQNLSQNTTIQLPQLPPEKKSKLKALAFVEIGLFEIGFVAILLIVIFGALNYFNILKLSTVIPQLTFLPHQGSNKSNNTITPPANPFPTSLSQQKEFFSTALQTLLKKPFLPPASTTFTPTKRSIDAQWITDNLLFKATMITAPSQLAGRVTLTIQPASSTISTPLIITSKASLSTSLADSLVTTYFQRNGSFSSWSCDKNTNRIFCQQVLTTSQNKLSIGVRENIASNSANPVSLLACLVPSANQIYQSNQSCL